MSLFVIKNLEILDECGQEAVYNEFDGFFTLTYEDASYTLTVKFHHHRDCVDGTVAWVDIGDRQYEFYNMEVNGGWELQTGGNND